MFERFANWYWPWAVMLYKSGALSGDLLESLDSYHAWRGLGLLPVAHLGVVTGIPLAASGSPSFWPIVVACAIGVMLGLRLAHVSGTVLRKEADCIERKVQRLRRQFAFPRFAAALVVSSVLLSPYVLGGCLYLLVHDGLSWSRDQAASLQPHFYPAVVLALA